MSFFGQPGGSRKTVTEKDVKLCALCGALNHHKNAECFTCGWRGVFDRDEATIHLAWQRIIDQYERVELEHVSGNRGYSVAELGGPAKPAPAAKNLADRIRAWWQGVLARRESVIADRERRPRAQSTPPNELGV